MLAKDLIKRLEMVPADAEVLIADPEYGFDLTVGETHYFEKEKLIWLIMDPADTKDLPECFYKDLNLPEVNWEDTEQLDPHAVGATVDAEFTQIPENKESTPKPKVDSIPSRKIREISRFL